MVVFVSKFDTNIELGEAIDNLIILSSLIADIVFGCTSSECDAVEILIALCFLSTAITSTDILISEMCDNRNEDTVRLTDFVMPVRSIYCE